MRGLYVYAVAAAPMTLRARGIFGRALQEVRVGRLHAIVEPASRQPKGSLARLRAQHRVLARFVERGIDILPVRFGTFVPDAEALARAIDEQAPALTRALKTVKGCVQMTVRLTLVDPGPARSKRPAGRRRAESGSIGTAYLRARAAAQDSTGHGQVDRAVRAIARAVAPHVRAMRTESSERQATLFHLVHRRRIALHRQALAGAAGRTGAFVTVSGPLPPFAFADAGPGR